MYRRNLRGNILAALADSPVVLVNGARQAGKTTLVRDLGSREHTARYITFDDVGFLSAARSDPAGFLSALAGPVILDEIQHAPELFPAIKTAVDIDRTPGRYLLTGSANVMLLPRMSESLAGRMEIMTLWPLAQSEIENGPGGFVDSLFQGDAEPLPPWEGSTTVEEDVARRMLAGGFPEPLGRTSAARRGAWFRSYITTILQRDIRDLANLEGLTALPRLLSLTAARCSTLLNSSDLARDSGLPYTTLHRYMSLLQSTYLVRLVPAWYRNL
ncbi:MAG TPA: AAA family ATPase, partial [Chthonomonadales bacterium]|nr:AAA family ATPase [Chthonomonadales bacterium]